MSWRTLWTALKRLCGYAEATAPPDEPRTKTYAGETGLVEITAPVSSAEPLSPEEQAHHQFIVSNWTKLAAAAYAGFQRHGIGVVVIEKRTDGPARPVLEDAFETHDLAYATGMGMWTQRPPHSSAPGWLDEQFQTYEPLEAGLFLFRPAGDGNDEASSATPPRPYHAAGTPPPPEALKQSRAPFN